MKKTINKITSFALAFAMMLTLMPSMVFAANVSAASDNMTRQKISETSDHVITFTPTTTDGGDVVITFDSDFDTSSGASGDGTFDTGAGTLTITGGVTSGVAVTATVTGIGNPATPGNRVISIATGADTGEITVPIITDDQIQVTARVDQTLFFDVRDGTTGTADDNAVGFGTLDSGTVRYATDDGLGTTTEGASSELEAGTNASGGYIIDVTGETLVAMDGSGNDIDGLFTPTPTPAVGTEAFGISVAQTQASTDTVPGSSDGLVAADYSAQYHLPDSTATDVLVTNTGPAANEIYDINYVANISSLTPAGNYSTVLTYTMTANF